jgi:hypothetical protein
MLCGLLPFSCKCYEEKQSKRPPNLLFYRRDYDMDRNVRTYVAGCVVLDDVARQCGGGTLPHQHGAPVQRRPLATRLWVAGRQAGRQAGSRGSSKRQESQAGTQAGNQAGRQAGREGCVCMCVCVCVVFWGGWTSAVCWLSNNTGRRGHGRQAGRQASSGLMHHRDRD